MIQLLSRAPRVPRAAAARCPNSNGLERGAVNHSHKGAFAAARAMLMLVAITSTLAPALAASGKWTARPTAGFTARNLFSALVLPNDDVLVIGGDDSSSFSNQVWATSNFGASWSLRATGPWDRMREQAATVVGSKVLVAGGVNTDGGRNRDVHVSTNNGASWSTLSSAPWSARSAHMCVTLGDESVLVMAGWTGSVQLRDVWKSTDDGVSWTQLATPGWQGMSDGAAVAFNNVVVVLGGIVSLTKSNAVWKSSDGGNSWGQMANPGWQVRSHFVAVNYGASAVFNGINTIIIAAGEGASSRLNDMWQLTSSGWSQVTFDSGSASWSVRSGLGMVALPYRSLLLMGGIDGGGSLRNDVYMFCPTGYTLSGNLCIPCSAGQYDAAADQATKSCTACPTGKYNSNGYGDCVDCSAGTRTNNAGTGSSFCSTCGAGTYAAAGSSTCTNCDVGDYSSAGQGSCSTCSGGTKVKGDASGCDTCAAGKYSGAGSTSCLSCDPGDHSSSGSSSCTACAAGTSAKGDASGCDTCAAGKYSGAASTSCLSCDPGEHSSSGSSSCTACAAGTKAKTDASGCDACAAGKYSDAGSTSCLDCDPGEHSSSGSPSCTPCAAGTIAKGDASGCDACDAGKYSGAGSTTCLSCAAGDVSSSGSSTCTACDAGRYAVSDASACGTCEAGKYSDAGSTGCLTCTAGDVSSAGSASCTTCAAGTFANSDASACDDCGAGTYSDPGSTGCTSCAAGSVSIVASANCTTCLAGTYANGAASACLDCGVGTFSADGATSCTACTAGWYSEVGQPACTLCPAGTYVNADSSGCNDCPAGTFSVDGTASVNGCQACTPGTFSESGSATCTPCGPGTYSSSDGTSCDPCPGGTFTAATGSTSVAECSDCAPGTFSSGGAASCDSCAEGTRSAAGESTCTDCTAGTFSAGGVGSCTPCTPGSWSGDAAGACTNCAAGTYSASDARSCLDCPAGTFSGALGAASIVTCVPCVAGSRSSDGAASCSLCPAGTWSDSGQSDCLQCVAGKFSVGGLGVCRPCPLGSISGEGAGACTACDAGKYSRADHLVCDMCAPGKYNGATGAGSANSCLRCPAGGFSGAGAESCTHCPVGKFSTRGQETCTLCEPGTATNSVNTANQCDACEPGTFAAAAGASECDPCPAGQHAADEGQQGCAPCPRGKFSDGGNPQCKPCPEGTHNDLEGGAGNSSCVACEFAGICLADNACSDGYRGHMCAECSRGHYPFRLTCSKCGAVGLGITILGFVALGGVVYLVVMGHLDSNSMLVVRELAFYLQLLGLIVNGNVRYFPPFFQSLVGQWMQLLWDGTSFTYIRCFWHTVSWMGSLFLMLLFMSITLAVLWAAAWFVGRKAAQHRKKVMDEMQKGQTSSHSKIQYAEASHTLQQLVTTMVLLYFYTALNKITELALCVDTSTGSHLAYNAQAECGDRFKSVVMCGAVVLVAVVGVIAVTQIEEVHLYPILRPFHDPFKPMYVFAEVLRTILLVLVAGFAQWLMRNPVTMNLLFLTCLVFSFVCLGFARPWLEAGHALSLGCYKVKGNSNIISIVALPMLMGLVLLATMANSAEEEWVVDTSGHNWAMMSGLAALAISGMLGFLGWWSIGTSHSVLIAGMSKAQGHMEFQSDEELRTAAMTQPPNDMREKFKTYQHQCQAAIPRMQEDITMFRIRVAHDDSLKNDKQVEQQLQSLQERVRGMQLATMPEETVILPRCDLLVTAYKQEARDLRRRVDEVARSCGDGKSTDGLQAFLRAIAELDMAQQTLEFRLDSAKTQLLRSLQIRNVIKLRELIAQKRQDDAYSRAKPSQLELKGYGEALAASREFIRHATEAKNALGDEEVLQVLKAPASWTNDPETLFKGYVTTRHMQWGAVGYAEAVLEWEASGTKPTGRRYNHDLTVERFNKATADFENALNTAREQQTAERRQPSPALVATLDMMAAAKQTLKAGAEALVIEAARQGHLVWARQQYEKLQGMYQRADPPTDGVERLRKCLGRGRALALDALAAAPEDRRAMVMGVEQESPFDIFISQSQKDTILSARMAKYLAEDWEQHHRLVQEADQVKDAHNADIQRKRDAGTAAMEGVMSWDVVRLRDGLEEAPKVCRRVLEELAMRALRERQSWAAKYIYETIDRVREYPRDPIEETKMLQAVRDVRAAMGPDNLHTTTTLPVSVFTQHCNSGYLFAAASVVETIAEELGGPGAGKAVIDDYVVMLGEVGEAIGAADINANKRRWSEMVMHAVGQSHSDSALDTALTRMRKHVRLVQTSLEHTRLALHRAWRLPCARPLRLYATGLDSWHAALSRSWVRMIADVLWRESMRQHQPRQGYLQQLIEANMKSVPDSPAQPIAEEVDCWELAAKWDRSGPAAAAEGKEMKAADSECNAKLREFARKKQDIKRVQLGDDEDSWTRGDKMSKAAVDQLREFVKSSRKKAVKLAAQNRYMSALSWQAASSKVREKTAEYDKGAINT